MCVCIIISDRIYQFIISDVNHTHTHTRIQCLLVSSSFISTLIQSSKTDSSSFVFSSPSQTSSNVSSSLFFFSFSLFDLARTRYLDVSKETVCACVLRVLTVRIRTRTCSGASRDLTAYSVFSSVKHRRHFQPKSACCSRCHTCICLCVCV